jgi:hypothetical protein
MALVPAAAAVPKQSRKRRAVSDPGQQQPAPPALTRLRVRAPKLPPPDRKRVKQEKEAAVMALLEQTHARRLAAIALLEVSGAVGAPAPAAAASSQPK